MPDRNRVAPRRHRLPDRAAQLLYDNQIEAYVWNLEELSSPQCLNKIMNLMDYKFVVLSASNTRRRERGFIMGMGVSNVYRSEHLHSNSWERLSYSIELPPDTLVYGEFVEEIRGLEIYPTDRKRD
ncbi:hypothetical protein, partial [Solihabitans fulvus]|uniref:hypothetical protein n=1 Tax=Solihabitans fulvus TaxID=1892852 RepID=UPI001CB76769